MKTPGVVVVALAGTLTLAAQERSAGLLTVEVLSTHRLEQVTFTPLSPRDWIRRCAECGQKPATAPLAIRVSGDGVATLAGKPIRSVELDGAFRVGEDGGGISVDGVWKVRPENGQLRVLLTMDSERYVALALEGEATTTQPSEWLKAMAVTIRTFALENAGRHAKEGFDLCDSTHCQALRYAKPAPDMERAVQETAGETLWYAGRRAEVFYTQNCGGKSEAAAEAWPGVHVPYLSEHDDPWCVRRGAAEWHAEVPVANVVAVSRAQGWKLPATITSVRVVKRTAAGRARLLEFDGAGTAATVSASSFRFAIDRVMGWNRLRSDWYSVSLSGSALDFTGRGYGHGVGLCQAGAQEMASEGRSYREILAFYFPGTKLGVSDSDGGWQKEQEAGWTMLSVGGAPGLRAAANAAWEEAQRLFPPKDIVAPVVRAFPTTELFRESVQEPGWVLAATHGTEIALQPPEVLARSGKEDETLRHEFLHVLVEHEAGAGTPLWLREGLVEALADEQAGGGLAASDDPKAFDAALTHPASYDDALRAHAEAAAMVRALIAAYGMEQVRGWLRGGVPGEALTRLRPPHSRPEAGHP